MGLKALMVDVDGVLVHPQRGGHWSDGLEAELGLSRAALDQHFSPRTGRTSCWGGPTCMSVWRRSWPRSPRI
ncbi:hypothetical protein MQH10_24690 [Phenylobacterium aquaticum]|nr:hypothetical protein [Phenylobacterium aquaticum]MCI3135399.1 hypothetical protein [Phenylobacterium aquaticum]